MDFLLVFSLIAGSALTSVSISSTNQGSKCKPTSDGEEGICMAVNECFEVPKNRYKKNVTLCGMVKQTPLVCCSSNQSEPSSEAALALSFTASSRPTAVESKSRNKCQEYARLVYVGEDEKIERCTIRADSKKIGLAAMGEFPHMVSLVYRHIYRTNQTSNNCGGSLISEKFVLTAAHCITELTLKRSRLRLVWVMLGVVNLSRTDVDKPQVIPIAQIIPHPDYDSHLPSRPFDVGLLKLKRAPVLGPLVRPACLPQKDEDFSSRELVLSGWGSTRIDKGISKTLIKVVLFEAPNHICHQYYSDKGVVLHNESQLCAGHPISKSNSCQGDSGGPLQVISLNAHCMYTIVAVTSFGDRECDSGNPGVYSRVQYFSRWIENIIWN